MPSPRFERRKGCPSGRPCAASSPDSDSPLPWESSEQETTPQTTLRVKEALDQSVSYTEHARRVSRFLENLCEERSCRPPQAAAFWEVFDKVEYLVSKGEMKEPDAIRTLNKILERSKQVASRGAAT